MKSAYLIIAHNEYTLLGILVNLLDDSNNDIYIHIDRDVEEPNKEELHKNAQKSNLYFVKNRISVFWGGEGLLYAEFELLREAKSKRKYEYYHLLSGADLPIKTNHDINMFFENNMYNNKDGIKKTNYLVARKCKNKIMRSHVSQYNFFIKYWKRETNAIVRNLFKALNRLGVYVQWCMGIDRFKPIKMDVYQGDTWWSITDELSDYLIDMEDRIKTIFNGRMFGADEYAIQTFVANSEFRNTLFDSGVTDKELRPCLRELDFFRGNGCGSPHVYTNEDYELLINSRCLYARKFNYSLYPEIVQAIYDYICSR